MPHSSKARIKALICASDRDSWCSSSIIFFFRSPLDGELVTLVFHGAVRLGRHTVASLHTHSLVLEAGDRYRRPAHMHIQEPHEEMWRQCAHGCVPRKTLPLCEYLAPGIDAAVRTHLLRNWDDLGTICLITCVFRAAAPAGRIVRLQGKSLLTREPFCRAWYSRDTGIHTILALHTAKT